MLYPLLAQNVPDLAHSAGTPTDLSWWGQYGPLGVAVAVFAIVIAYLFRLMRTDHKEIAAERTAFAVERTEFAVERERLKTEYETKHVALSEKYAAALIAEVKLGRSHELDARRDDAERLETVAASQEKNAEKMTLVIEKLTDKLITISTGPKGRYGG